MTELEMEILKAEFGEKLEIKDCVKTMDDYSYDFDVKKEIYYDGIIVGSDIVDLNFVKQNILKMLKKWIKTLTNSFECGIIIL